jgi:hypothetical protein
MLQPIFDRLSIMPGPSAQTTSVWPLVIREEDEQVISQSVGHDVGGPIIQAPREKTWDEVTEEVLSEYSEAWERLAEL